MNPLTEAQRILRQRHGRELTPEERYIVDAALNQYGPEQVYMDGELYVADL